MAHRTRLRPSCGRRAPGAEGLQNLEPLFLERTKITDAGLKELKRHANVQILLLTNTQVGDAGLKELEEHANLQQLLQDRQGVGRQLRRPTPLPER